MEKGGGGDTHHHAGFLVEKHALVEELSDAPLWFGFGIRRRHALPRQCGVPFLHPENFLVRLAATTSCAELTHDL